WDGAERPEALLGVADIHAMQAEGGGGGGGIDFGSHTATHGGLTRLGSVDGLRELRSSREQLGTLLGKPVTVVCYPYGDYNRATLQLARDAGYEAGVIIRRRMNSDAT